MKTPSFLSRALMRRRKKDDGSLDPKSPSSERSVFILDSRPTSHLSTAVPLTPFDIAADTPSQNPMLITGSGPSVRRRRRSSAPEPHRIGREGAGDFYHTANMDTKQTQAGGDCEPRTGRLQYLQLPGGSASQRSRSWDKRQSAPPQPHMTYGILRPLEAVAPPPTGPLPPIPSPTTRVPVERFSLAPSSKSFISVPNNPVTRSFIPNHADSPPPSPNHVVSWEQYDKDRPDLDRMEMTSSPEPYDVGWDEWDGYSDEDDMNFLDMDSDDNDDVEDEYTTIIRTTVRSHVETPSNSSASLETSLVSRKISSPLESLDGPPSARSPEFPMLIFPSPPPTATFEPHALTALHANVNRRSRLAPIPPTGTSLSRASSIERDRRDDKSLKKSVSTSHLISSLSRLTGTIHYNSASQALISHFPETTSTTRFTSESKKHGSMTIPTLQPVRLRRSSSSGSGYSRQNVSINSYQRRTIINRVPSDMTQQSVAFAPLKPDQLVPALQSMLAIIKRKPESQGIDDRTSIDTRSERSETVQWGYAV